MPKASLGAFPKLHGPLVIRAGTFQYSIHVRIGEERLLMTFNNGGGSPLNFIGKIPRSATKQTATKIRNQTKKTSQHPFDPKNKKNKIEKKTSCNKSAHPFQNKFLLTQDKTHLSISGVLFVTKNTLQRKKNLDPQPGSGGRLEDLTLNLAFKLSSWKKIEHLGGIFSQISNSPVKRLQKVPQLDLWMLVSL